MCTKYDVMHPFYDPHARVMKCATGTLAPLAITTGKGLSMYYSPTFYG